MYVKFLKIYIAISSEFLNDETKQMRTATCSSFQTREKRITYNE